MAGVQIGVTEPGRFGRALAAAMTAQLLSDGVGVTAARPLGADDHTVVDQRILVTAPHLDRRMMPPALGDADEGAHDLLRLDALLAEPDVVEHLRRLGEVRIGQEGLHRIEPTVAITRFAPAAAAILRNPGELATTAGANCRRMSR